MEKKLNKDLEYWKNNAIEDYITTPISVLRYIGELEKEVLNQHKEENITNDGECGSNELIEIDNAYIEDADSVGSYDVTGRFPKVWVKKSDFDNVKCINN